MKILFINPPSETPFKKDDPYYPLGLLYLASILEKDGHRVLVKDYYRYSLGEKKKEIIKLVEDYSPDIVGLSCVTMNRLSNYELIKITKKINPRIKIIIGGIHATSMYEQILLNYPVDAIVLGEGEVSTPKLINALGNFAKTKEAKLNPEKTTENFRREQPNCSKFSLGENKSLKKIKGIAFKDKENVYFTGLEKYIANLDELPFPKHELCEELIKKTKSARVITSRGCPYNCIFCSTAGYWGRKWRARSAKNVVDEIEYLIKKFPYLKNIVFPDDTSTLDNQRMIDICEDMIKRKIKINWICSGRLDVISEKMLCKMKEAGCKLMAYGIESGSSKMLKTIKKGITREQIEKTIKLTNKVGLHYGAYLMVGNPGETWETVKETVLFIKKLENIDFWSVGRLEIYPNTEIYEIAKRQGIIDDSYWLTNKKIPHYTFEHSEDELTKMAYYIVAKHQLNKGLPNFIIFCFKFFLEKPKKAIRYALLKLRILRDGEKV